MVALEVLEHESGGTSPAEFVSFVGQRQGRLRIRLLGPNPDAPASVLRFFNVTPIECQYVTDTQPRKTTEKGCLLEFRNVARRLGQLADFLKCQILPAAALRRDGFQEFVDVLRKHLLMVCGLQAAPEGGPVPGSGILRQGLGVILEVFRGQKIITEPLTEGNRYIRHQAFPMTVVLEVVVNPNPFLVLGIEFLPEVGEEVHLLLMLVQEIELSPDDGKLPLRTNGLRLSVFLLVCFLLDGELGLVNEIDAKVFTEDEVLRHRIPQRRVEIQIEGYPPAFQLALIKCYFSGFHGRNLFEKFIEFGLLIPDEVPFSPDFGHSGSLGFGSKAFGANVIVLNGIISTDIVPTNLGRNLGSLVLEQPVELRDAEVDVSSLPDALDAVLADPVIECLLADVIALPGLVYGDVVFPEVPAGYPGIVPLPPGNKEGLSFPATGDLLDPDEVGDVLTRKTLVLYQVVSVVPVVRIIGDLRWEHPVKVLLREEGFSFDDFRPDSLRPALPVQPGRGYLIPGNGVLL